MVPPVATMTTLGFFAPWAHSVPAAIVAASISTAIRMSFTSVSPRASMPRLESAADEGRSPRSLLLGRVFRLVEVRELHRVEEILDLSLGQHLVLPDDLEDALAALVRLVRELGGLLVPDDGV